MRKKFTFFLVVFILFNINSIAQNLSIDQILTEFYTTAGYDNMSNVKTILMSGSIIFSDLMPLKITKKRPDKYRMDFEYKDMPAVYAYNGESGWGVLPWTQNPEPVLMSEADVKELELLADIDGSIYNWKQKGYLAELLGTEKLGDNEAYKIKITRNEGEIMYYFIDNVSFLLQKLITYVTSNGEITQHECYYKDYKQVDDIWFAFTHDLFVGGEYWAVYEFEKIEVNIPVNDSIFNLPEK